MRSTITALAGLLVLLLGQSSNAAPAARGDGPPPRPFARRPIPPQVNDDQAGQDDQPSLAQIQEQLRQLSKQVEKLQKTLDDQARKELQNRQYSPPNFPRDQQNYARTPGWQERGEYPPQRMPQRPGMMGQRGMMQFGDQRNRQGPTDGRGWMGPQRPMYRQNQMGGPGGQMEQQGTMMNRRGPWGGQGRMGQRGMMSGPMEQQGPTMNRRGPMGGQRMMGQRGMMGGGGQMEQQGPMMNRRGPMGGQGIMGERGMMNQGAAQREGVPMRPQTLPARQGVRGGAGGRVPQGDADRPGPLDPPQPQ